MATTRRPAAMRALAREMEERFGTRFDAEHSSGATWRLTWYLGPCEKTVRDFVAQAGDRLGGADVEFWRSEGRDRDLALAVIRLAIAGELEPAKRWGGRYSTRSQAEAYLRATAYPERATDREEAMAARLMAAASRPLAYGVSPHVDTDAMCNLVDERGIGWLLVPEQRPDQVPDGVSAGSAAGAGDSTLGRQNKADSLTAGPLERLTARYAEGEAARDWQRFGRTITRRAAVDAALADPGLPDSELLAVLALWKELQAEIDEIAKVTAGRLAGAVGRKAFTYEQIGDVLGVKRQSAHTWVAGRIQGAPLRRRNPPA